MLRRDVTNQSESLVSDILVFPPGDGKIGNLFLQCTLFAVGDVNAPPPFSKHNNVGIYLSPLIFTGEIFMYFIQHCFTCHQSDSTVWQDAGIEPKAGICKSLRSPGIDYASL